MADIDAIKAMIMSGQGPSLIQNPAPTRQIAHQSYVKAGRSILDDDSDSDEDENIWAPGPDVPQTLKTLEYFDPKGAVWKTLKKKEQKKSMNLFYDWLDSEESKMVQVALAEADNLFS